MDTPGENLSTARVGAAARACCDAIEVSRNWTRDRVHWRDAGKAWVDLVDAIDAFSQRARLADEPPERMVIRLKAILEATLPSAETTSAIRDAIISHAIESYFKPIE